MTTKYFESKEELEEDFELIEEINNDYQHLLNEITDLEWDLDIAKNEVLEIEESLNDKIKELEEFRTENKEYII